VRTYRAGLGYQPDQFAAQAYTGVQLLADAIAGLRTIETVLGRFSFGPDREPMYAPVIQQVRGYGFVKIG
jgi:branched-chain amino acid transport system substrate-binding protein